MTEDLAPIAGHERAQALLDRPRTLGVLATNGVDGAPHQVQLWYLVFDDHLVVNGRAGRTWPANLLRDPTFSFLVGAGGEWVSLSGRGEEVEDRAQGQRDIAMMAAKYLEPEVAERSVRGFVQEERASFRLMPTRIVVHPDDTLRKKRMLARQG